MVHALPYENDEKAKLHESLPELARAIASRSRMDKEITLDSYIISATEYDDLCRKYDDGTWDRKKFASRHILFLERDKDYNYLKIIFNEHIRNSPA